VWYTPVIPAIWETEVKRLPVPGQPGLHSETVSNKTKQKPKKIIIPFTADEPEVREDKEFIQCHTVTLWWGCEIIPELESNHRFHVELVG
jgi:hypothetical protein